MQAAVSAAWNAFNAAFSVESLPHGMISSIFEPEALKRIDDVMGKAGNGLALIQIATDLGNKDTLSAMSNSIKTGLYYTIGKWGWKSLKIAGAGLQVFDYMLTAFSEITRFLPDSKAWRTPTTHITTADREGGT